QILGTPVLAVTILLLGLERVLGVGIFNPALGGDPLLFQHLFWFYSHPAVYIMILPAFGVINQIVPCFSRRPIFGYNMMSTAMMAIDVHVHDTYFVVAHFHYIMVGGAVMAYMGGIHFWWPKMTGRMYPEIWGKLSALTIFLGFNLTFFPQFILGYNGMPRRYYEYPPEFQVLHVMSTAGASILAVGYLMPLIYLLLSLRIGPRAGSNPWNATGLEWSTPSPPPTHNFAQTPIVRETP